MKRSELKEFLDEKVILYNNTDFISSDPVQIPHRFTLKEDIEIAGFLAATIAWGNRKSIITSADKMMGLMGESPYDFVMNHSNQQLKTLSGFVHRTFNGDDLMQFVSSLRRIYEIHGGLESLFSSNSTPDSMQPAISRFKEIFFEGAVSMRTKKHISDPLKGSSAKRINMFLRWMVRNDNAGVDFGLWKSISPSILSCPLDVHTGNTARKLRLIKRKSNDSKTLSELDTSLRKLDPSDPVKYDYALFGLGVFEKF